MKVIKVLNTSVVLVKRRDGKEVIILGKGIGFRSKPGDYVLPEEVEKTYVLENKSVTLDVAELLTNVPNEYLQLVNEIVEYATKVLNVQLCETLYVSLIDHLYIAVKRMNNNKKITNRMHWEIQKLYPAEYDIGLYSLSLIKKYINTDFPEEEAANIAFHLVNAQQVDGNIEHVLLLSSIVRDILNIVKVTFEFEFDTSSINYSRFVTHLQYFSQRLVSNKMLKNSDDELLIQASNKYVSEYNCIVSICEYVNARFDKIIPNEELLYLLIHVNRVVERENKE